jgi:hypothetical protein
MTARRLAGRETDARSFHKPDGRVRLGQSGLEDGFAFEFGKRF